MPKASESTPEKMTCPACQATNRETARRCRKCRTSLELAVLQVLDGELPKTAYYLRPTSYTIGRAPENDISLVDSSISRRHAHLSFEDGSFVLEDLHSRHGVHVGHRKVKRETLESDSVVRLGRVTLKFAVLDREGSTDRELQIPPERLRTQAQVGHEAAAKALDRLQMGVVLVAADASVVLANRSARAILDEADALSVGSTGLRALDTASNRALRDLLLESPEDGHTKGGALAIARRHRRPLTVLVTPLGREGSRLEAPLAVKALFISDPEKGVETGEETLRRLYGLTPAESRFVSELLQGRRLEETATELGISVHTARDHLRHVFDKTGTRRQSELVRLLLTGPAQLRHD